MSPFSFPVVAGAAAASAPAWLAWASGTVPVDAALSRFLVCVLLVWAAFSAVAALVGPPPRPDTATSREEPASEPVDRMASRSTG